MHLEAVRLIVFFLAISTFYIGSIQFFDKVHARADAGKLYPKTAYAVDFWIGLLHFVMFFFCAETIDDFQRTKMGFSMFFVYLAFIFLYDIVWWFVNRGLDSVEEIKVWTWSSAVTVFLAWVAFLTIKYVIGRDDVVAEHAILMMFFLYLFVDLVELLTGKLFFSNLLMRLLPKTQVQPVKPATQEPPAS